MPQTASSIGAIRSLFIPVKSKDNATEGGSFGQKIMLPADGIISPRVRKMAQRVIDVLALIRLSTRQREDMRELVLDLRKQQAWIGAPTECGEVCQARDELHADV